MAGNWKMYKTPAETVQFFEKFRPLVEKSEHCEIVICPPFTNLAAAVDAAKGTRVRVGAQNIAWAKEGAFTGEISGPMISAVGSTHAIVGHSERRQYFAETDETVLKRTLAALEFGITPIVCVGERLEERESGNTEAVLVRQFRNGIAGLTPEQFGRIVIAYEPVWAIGTGKTATPEIAADAHRTIRGQVREKFGAPAPRGGGPCPGDRGRPPLCGRRARRPAGEDLHELPLGRRLRAPDLTPPPLIFVNDAPDAYDLDDWTAGVQYGKTVPRRAPPRHRQVRAPDHDHPRSLRDPPPGATIQGADDAPHLGASSSVPYNDSMLLLALSSDNGHSLLYAAYDGENWSPWAPLLTDSSADWSFLSGFAPEMEAKPAVVWTETASSGYAIAGTRLP